MRGYALAGANDEELVISALVGDLDAYDELVRRYRGAVITVADQVLGSYEPACDVAQEALLLAFKALPQLEEPAKFAAWLCAITRRRALRVLERDRRSEPTEPSELDRLILDQSGELRLLQETDFWRRLEREAVRAALAQLPPEHQIVLRLRYYEEWRVEQIAGFLSLPITTVKWRLHRGRELLRRRLTIQTEEDSHGRERCGAKRDATDPPPAAHHRAPGERRQPDGNPGKRRGHSGAAVQSGLAAP